MNKLCTLSNVELKRNYKYGLLYIFLFFITNIVANIIQISRFLKRDKLINEMIAIFDGVTYGYAILYHSSLIPNIILLGTFILIIYFSFSWIKDWLGKDKSRYTFLLLPQNKFNIIVGKIVALVFMVYSFILSQLLALFISKLIFNMYCKNLLIIKTSFLTDINTSIRLNLYIGNNFISFALVNVTQLLCIVSFVLCILIGIISFIKRLKIDTIIILILLIIFVFLDYKLVQFFYDDIVSTGGYFLKDILYYFPVFIGSNVVSYYIINKKVGI